jgi:hypothetical protein
VKKGAKELGHIAVTLKVPSELRSLFPIDVGRKGALLEEKGRRNGRIPPFFFRKRAASSKNI